METYLVVSESFTTIERSFLMTDRQACGQLTQKKSILLNLLNHIYFSNIAPHPIYIYTFDTDHTSSTRLAFCRRSCSTVCQDHVMALVSSFPCGDGDWPSKMVVVFFDFSATSEFGGPLLHHPHQALPQCPQWTLRVVSPPDWGGGWPHEGWCCPFSLLLEPKMVKNW